VALALGLREEPQQTIQDTLKGHLKGKNLLLLLDNCEHLIEPCAQLVESLLSQCPNVKVLATSREPLRIGAEQTYPVPPLPTPDPTSIRKREKDLSMLLQYDAIRLFVERARQQRSDFSLSRPNSAAVASVCHRLDGIPLAIELAAARVRSLTVEQINTRLDQRFRLLTGGSRTALPRQQTLQALIDWSYDLLTPQEQTLLGRLSVFAGGWTLEAAEAVCEEGVGRWALGVREMRLRSDAAPDSQSPMVAQRLTPNAQRPLDVLDLLTSLVDKSLVIYEERTEAVRYRMLETVREYAQAKLGASGEAQAVSDRHRDWFLALAEEADAKLTGPQQTEWLARLETEHDNLRAALARSVTDQAHDAGAMLRFCAALGPFWRTLGYLEEGRYWCVEALASTAPSGGTNERTRVLNGVGVLAQYQGDFASARTYHEQSLAIQRELADRPGIAASLHNLASVAQELGDLASARAIYEESLQIKREIGDRAGVAISLNNLGALAHDQGDYVAARAYHEQSLEIKRELGDRQGVAASLNNLGAAAQDQGDYPAAWTYHEQSLAIKREIGNRRGIAFSLHNLGAVAHDQGNYAAARAYYEESLTIRREIGDQRGAAKSLHNLGHVAYDQGDHSAARHYYEESLTLRREIGDRQGVAASLHNLGAAAHDQGDFTSARDYHEQSLAIRREVGDRQGVATALHNLGVVAFHQGDYASARACFHQSLPIFHQIGDRRSIVDSLEELARLATEEGALERGARLWGAAASLRAEIGAPRAPREQAAHERAIAATRTGMEARAFEMAWDAGHTMPLEQTVAFALQASQL
jgi:predicted ATPase/Tfp pilus assembly protein PilF